MKKILFLSFISFILAGCSTVQPDKYKNDINIKSQIKSTEIKGV